jgi:nucleoside-diphosphate-sugar epimerase
MVIGRGMIAIKFLCYEDENVLFFASGVSNSNEIDEKAFQKEEALLRNTLQERGTKTFVYFSSCDVENPQLSSKAYYQHKLKMENIVSSHVGEYYIFRLPQVVGRSSNKNTLINFLLDKIKSETSFEIYSGTKKNIIDIDDVYSMVTYIIKHKIYVNSTCNIVNTIYISILDVVKIIEKTLGKQAHYVIKNIDTSHCYNAPHIASIAKESGILFDDNYHQRLISKYSY